MSYGYIFLAVYCQRSLYILSVLTLVAYLYILAAFTLKYLFLAMSLFTFHPNIYDLTVCFWSALNLIFIPICGL